MDGTDSENEPWLVELRAESPSRLDLDVDVILVSDLWDLGATGVTEIDGRMLAGFAGGAQARKAAEQIRSLVAEASARPASDTATGVAVPRSDTSRPGPSTVMFTVGDTVRSISVVAGPTFGHGHHATTELALRLLGSALHRASADRPLADLRVLDFGTGSGVLAVAAAVAGAGTVVGVDLDPTCAPVVAANGTSNGVDVEVVIGAVGASSETPPGPPLDTRFDVIVANLLLIEHLEVAETLRLLLASDGRLVMSGYLIDQADRLLTLHPGLVVEQSSINGDWIGHLLTNPADRVDATSARPGFVLEPSSNR